MKLIKYVGFVAIYRIDDWDCFTVQTPTGKWIPCNTMSTAEWWAIELNDLTFYE